MKFSFRCKCTALLFCAVLLWGLGLLVGEALPALASGCLWALRWEPDGGYFGILLMAAVTLLGSGITVLGALAFALFLNLWLHGKDAFGKRFLLRLLTCTAAVPSVVWGILFLRFLCPMLQQITGLAVGTHFLASCLLLICMVTPTLTLTLYGAVAQLPPSLLWGGLALGLTRLQTVRLLLIPACRSHLRQGCALAFGRAAGETTAVLMVSGGAVNPPAFFSPVRWLSATVGGELAYALHLHRSALFAAAILLTLLCLPLCMGRRL